MKHGYIAVILAAKDDRKLFVNEVVTALRALPGGEVKFADAGHETTLCGFICDLDPDRTRRHFRDLWEADRRVWIFDPDAVVQGNPAIAEWIARRVAR